MPALPQIRTDDRAVVREARPALASLLRKIRIEYGEMPGLRLTREQARRLWALDAETCDSALEHLVDQRFLMRDREGRYHRQTQG